MDNKVGIGSTDTHATDIKTSQTIFSLVEGKSGGSSNGPNLYGTDGAPTGLSTKEAMSFENQLKTTSQIKGELSTPEGK